MKRGRSTRLIFYALISTCLMIAGASDAVAARKKGVQFSEAEMKNLTTVYMDCLTNSIVSDLKAGKSEGLSTRADQQCARSADKIEEYLFAVTRSRAVAQKQATKIKTAAKDGITAAFLKAVLFRNKTASNGR
jgi:hypothetical protein